MARINTKDLGQILIKETTADTNDVFNVLISQGAKGGFAVATQLINVLNISILFIMYQDHLILPLFLLFYHSAVSPFTFSEPSEVVPAPPPILQGELEGLQGCAFMCLNFLWPLLVKKKKIKDGVKTNNRIVASNI